MAGYGTSRGDSPRGSEILGGTPIPRRRENKEWDNRRGEMTLPSHLLQHEGEVAVVDVVGPVNRIFGNRLPRRLDGIADGASLQEVHVEGLGKGLRRCIFHRPVRANVVRYPAPEEGFSKPDAPLYP